MTDIETVGLVVPTYNEEAQIAEHLKYHGTHFQFDECVVVDGGSEDNTVSSVRSVSNDVKIVELPAPSRGRQLREGCKRLDSQWIIMLHADSFLPRSFQIEWILKSEHQWGWFDCRLDDSSGLFPLISKAISYRSALFSTPTGDQGIWVKQSLLDSVGGIPPVPIMEDVTLVKELRSRESGTRFRTPVRTSARKWKREGVIKVMILMWWFRILHIAGVSPEWIFEQYYGTSPGSS